MAVVCPKHSITLEINHEDLVLPQGPVSIVTGICPKCRVKYANRTLMHACEQFSVDGTTYVFLQSLSKEYPFDPEAERKALEKAEEDRKAAEIEAEKRRKKEEKKRREKKEREEKSRQQKQAEIEQVLYAIKNTPHYKYRPVFVAYCDEIPTNCPFDGNELKKLNIYKRGVSASSGYCCIYCSRLFLLRGEQEKPKSDKTHPPRTWPSANSSAVRNAQPQIVPDILNLPSSLPSITKSAILTAHLFFGSSDVGFMTIAANAQEQNSAAGIYWVGRVLPSMVLAAIAKVPTHRFRYKGHEYAAYIETEFPDSKKYIGIVSRFIDSRSPQTVYVFAQKNFGIYNSSEYEMVTAMVPCSKSSFPVPVTVYYQKSTRMYFVNEVTYTEIRNRYGLPYLKLRLASGDEDIGQFGFLRQHSELNLLGYSVNSESDMDAPSRKKLLCNIIDSGLLSKQEIENHLEWLISTRTGNVNMENAVEAWTEDLNYVSQYNIEQQRTIWVNSFASKYTGQKAAL